MLSSLLLCTLMQVPACDFAGYVRAMVDELYAPLVAAIDGQLTGPGTLGTVALCECLLTLLSSWQITDQPYKMFRAYKILPLSNLQVTRKVDLSRYATLQGGVMYITEPAVQACVDTIWYHDKHMQSEGPESSGVP